MSLQWTLVSSFLYFEIGVICLLLLPFISPTRWQKIFRSRLVTKINSFAGIYFKVILVGLGVLFFEAIRGIIKYKSALDSEHSIHGHANSMYLVNEFRAQRNFYISGTSLFLWFVINRLAILISRSAQLIADNSATKSQAESATKTADTLLKELDILKSKSKNTEIESESKDAESTMLLRQKEDEVIELKQKLEKAKIDLDAMKKQSEGVSKEFDNLLKENEKLTKKIEKLENSSETKKSS